MGRSRSYSTDFKSQVIKVHEEGRSIGQITQDFGIPRSSVQTIVDHFAEFGKVAGLPKSEALKKLSPRTEKIIIRSVKKDPKATAKALVHELKVYGTSVCESTVRIVLYRH